MKGTSKISTKKYHHIFDTETLKNDLKGKSIRGGLNTMAAESFSFVMRIASTAVLARILMPEHFGLIGMVTALTVFAERFKDLGLSDSTVQRKEITHEQVSTLFWINLSVCTFIMLTIAALSHLFAWFYGEPRLVMISLALSSSFFFGGLTIQHQALLRRQMRFVSLAWIQILSTALSITVGISLALKGYAHWALVWKEVTTSMFTAIGTWLMCHWWPGLPARSSETGSMLRFGRNVTGFNIIYFLSRNLDKILIGRFWGADALGFYRQAYQLILMPINQLEFPFRYVAMPALSTLQNEPEKYRQYYKKIISILSFVSMPVVMYLGIFSENVIRLILGDRWLGAALIFRILAIGAFIQPVVVTCGIVMVTCGKTKQYFWWGVMNAALLIAALCLGMPWGPIGIAAAYPIANYALLITALFYGFRDTPISIRLFIKAISSAVLCSFIMAIVLILSAQKIALLSRPAGLPASILLAITAYCGAWLLLPEGKQRLIEYFSYPFVAFKFAPSFRKRYF